MSIKERLTKGWNAFMGRDPTPRIYNSYGDSSRPDRVYLTRGHERSMLNAALNRIAVDVAATTIHHVDLDENGRYTNDRDSYLNECLTISANEDQTARVFLHDAALSLLDEGIIAIVPTTATDDPRVTGSYDIGSLRVGKVVKWMPHFVMVSLYNEDTGEKETRTYPKHMVALPENPFYTVMNEPSSTYRRLVNKIAMLDVIDSKSASDKMNLIIQVPYSVHSPIQQERADARREKLETQLGDSRYGIAYIDGTEKVIQLNRSVENNLFNQVEYYMNLWLSMLGIPKSVLDGTADEATMLNYQNRTIEPIISAIVDSMKWKFLTKKARSQGQSIIFSTEPFRLVPVGQIAEIADKFTRNEILTSNEIRQIIGFKPSTDPTADELRNSNLYKEDGPQQQGAPDEEKATNTDA